MFRTGAKSCRKCYLYNQEVPKSPLLQKPPHHHDEKHPQWKGGTILYWKKKVKERDDFTCKNCGLREPEIMDVAHIKPIAGHGQRRYRVEDPNNLITLCPNCHRRFDKGLLKNTGHLKPG